jgi:DNA invertase Pin-like site-specific DNA recombinase
MAIVQTYADEGRSGLSLNRRDALKQLIRDVQAGNADFKAILVYDISRWGRFQDADESAHYEYICKLAGIRVHYCAEQFDNDGSPFSAIVKSIKRAMAGEYSRELSVKVFAGQARLLKLGLKIGGPVEYGLRRMLVDHTGAPKFILARGEYKSMQTDRVIAVLGPPEEVKIVRWIFSTFVNKKRSESEIAELLNKKCIVTNRKRRWTYTVVRRILRNESYIGNSVWNHTSLKLHGRQVRNPPETWLRADGVIEPIIERRLFEAAQRIIHDRSRIVSDEEKLEPLRNLLRERGFLTTKLIGESAGVPSANSYLRWFGSIRRAYDLIGYTGYRKLPDGRVRRSSTNTHTLTNEQILDLLRGVLKARGYLNKSIIDGSIGMPCSATLRRRFGSVARAYGLVGFPDVSNGAYQLISKRSMKGVSSRLSNDQFLETLRRLLQERGSLTARSIDKANGTPSSSAYQRRFGSLLRAYELIGYTATSSGQS